VTDHIRSTACTTSDKGVDSVSTSTAQYAVPASAEDESHVTGIDRESFSDRHLGASQPVFA